MTNIGMNAVKQGVKPVLEFKDYSVFRKEGKTLIPLVKSLNFCLTTGEKLGITGSSGAGKSISITSAMGLVPSNSIVTKGSAIFFGKYDFRRLDPDERRRVLSKEIGYIPQDAANSLNPNIRILDQLVSDLVFQLGITKSQALEKGIEVLEEVGISNKGDNLRKYPQEFSGGMRQRVVTAMIMAKNPSLLVADEPTSALDVVNQAKSALLLEKIMKEKDFTMAYISHSPGMIARLCRRILIMEKGRMVEEGPVEKVMENPQSEAGQRLISAAKELSYEQ